MIWYRLISIIAVSVVVLTVNAVAAEPRWRSIRASMRAEREKILNGHCTEEFTRIKRRGGGYNTDGEPIVGEGSFEQTARAYQHLGISSELEFDLDADSFLFERHINIKAPLGLSASKRQSDGLNELVRVLFGQSRDRVFKFTDRERKIPWLESVTREGASWMKAMVVFSCRDFVILISVEVDFLRMEMEGTKDSSSITMFPKERRFMSNHSLAISFDCG